MDETITLDLAYIALYGRFIHWLSLYADGDTDPAAGAVYDTLANTADGAGLFQAYAAGYKDGYRSGQITPPDDPAQLPDPLPKSENAAAFFEKIRERMKE